MVEIAKFTSPCPPVVGNGCQVLVGKKIYSGVTVAIGVFNGYFIDYR